MRAFFLCAAATTSVLATQPPCHSPLNPALETICFDTLLTDGNFSVRTYAKGLNVSLASFTSTANFEDWKQDSDYATAELFLYFDGSNAAFKRVATTVPLIYRPQPEGGAPTALKASMALPTSVYPDPDLAPKPSVGGQVIEAFSPITVAAFRFDTPTLATALQYAYACGQLGQWSSVKGFKPIAGPWEQAWVTYSGESASPHVNECWAQVYAP